MAEKVLIMTVPCHRALAALVVWSLHTNGPFPEFFAKAPRARKWFLRTAILFRRVGREETKPAFPEDAVSQNQVQWPTKLTGAANGFGHEPGPACGAERGGVGRFHAQNCALPRL